MIFSKQFRYLFFIAFTFFLYSCDTSDLRVLSEPETWYRTYSGKMGDKEIVIHLSKAESYKGYLWLKDTQIPVMVYSDPTINPGGDSIYLNGGNANRRISLKGILNKNISGEITFQTNGVQDPVEKVHLSRDNSFSAFQFIYTKGHAKLPQQLNNKSIFEYFMGSVWPLEKDLDSEKLKLPIEELIGMPSFEKDLSGWMDSLQKNSLLKWKEAGDSLTPEDAQIMGLSFSKQILNHLGVMYENETTITFANYVYAYEGGAHGNYSTTLSTIDKKTGRKLFPEDILSPEGINALPDLLVKAARRQYQITNADPLEDNGFFTNILLPTRNFYITTKGLGFYYTPYEIKPFSDGEINLFIPGEALQNYWLR